MKAEKIGEKDLSQWVSIFFIAFIGMVVKGEKDQPILARNAQMAYDQIQEKIKKEIFGEEEEEE